MKVLGYIMLHYGIEYLEYALTPLVIACDKVIILYSMNPTHNGKDGYVNTDHREKLMAIANKFNNVQWIDVFDIHGEGQHRNEIFKYTNGYDVLVNADYDEVWDLADLQRAIKETYASPYRNHGIDGFIHFWRSFGYVLHPDWFRPVRLVHLREKNTDKQPDIKAKIYHFGYAIKRRKMEYKMSIHGHRAEWDKNWLRTWVRWQPNNTEGKFHPCSDRVWKEIKQFDRTKLPKFLYKHPYFTKATI